MMKNVLIVGLMLVAVGSAFFGGVYYQRLQTPKSQTPKTVVVVPSPTPGVSEFNNDKATVKSFNGKELIYTLETGSEKTLADTTGVDVWLAPQKAGDKATKADWKAVKAGIKVQIASEKATGRVIALLVL